MKLKAYEDRQGQELSVLFCFSIFVLYLYELYPARLWWQVPSLPLACYFLSYVFV